MYNIKQSMFGVISSIIVNSVSTLSQNLFSYLKKIKLKSTTQMDFQSQTV